MPIVNGIKKKEYSFIKPLLFSGAKLGMFLFETVQKYSAITIIL